MFFKDKEEEFGFYRELYEWEFVLKVAKQQNYDPAMSLSKAAQLVAVQASNIQGKDVGDDNLQGAHRLINNREIKDFLTQVIEQIDKDSSVCFKVFNPSRLAIVCLKAHRIIKLAKVKKLEKIPLKFLLTAVESISIEDEIDNNDSISDGWANLLAARALGVFVHFSFVRKLTELEALDLEILKFLYESKTAKTIAAISNATNNNLQHLFLSIEMLSSVGFVRERDRNSSNEGEVSLTHLGILFMKVVTPSFLKDIKP